MDFDVVVIGGGIAGMVAANRAAELGQRVVVLEKSPEEQYICNSRFTYGTFHINFTSPTADEAELLRKIEDGTEGYARKDLARAVAKDGRRLMQWLRAKASSCRSRPVPHPRAVAGAAHRLRAEMEQLRRRRRAAAARSEFPEAAGPHPARHPRPRLEACPGRHRDRGRPGRRSARLQRPRRGDRRRRLSGQPRHGPRAHLIRSRQARAASRRDGDRRRAPHGAGARRRA